MDLHEQLRKAIKESNREYGDLARAANKLNGKRIDAGMIKDICEGIPLRDPQLTTISTLAEVLGLRLAKPQAEPPPEADVLYFSTREKSDLEDRISQAKRIRMITTKLSEGFGQEYIVAIQKALIQAHRNKTVMEEVKVLISHPDNPYLEARAHQHGIDYDEYRAPIVDAIRLIAAALRKKPNCAWTTYMEYPIQIWFLVDDYIYICTQSKELPDDPKKRATRDNCVFKAKATLPGIKETYLDHFDKLWNANPPANPHQTPR